MEDLNTQNWKEFKVEDVFGKSKLGKYHNPRDLRKDDNGYYYICASNMNNGVNSQMPRVNGDNLVLTPSKIIAWGKQCPMFTYHDEQCVTSQGMYYIDMSDYDENVALFICTALTVACKGKYSYSHCLIGSVMDKVVIKLPVKDSGEIDFNYMQERVKELEQERVKELEQERVKELDAYLKVTGLNDYELTEEDKKILNMQKKYNAFRVGDLFDIHPTKVYKLTNDDIYRTDGKTPVVSNSSENNGIGGYCGLTPTEPGNMITFSDTTTGPNTIFYQPDPFIGYPHVQGMYSKISHEWSEDECLYFISAIKHAAGKGWSYSVKFTRKVVADLKIYIPVKDSPYKPDEIDWEYIKNYMVATKKKIIANVVKKKDEIIEKTKEIVNKD